MQISKYQQAIVDWVKTGIGNGCCNAVAGSGKSTTLRLAAKSLAESGISPSEVKVIVFGKANSQDLIAKFGGDWKQSISTLHSAGFSLLKQELGIRDSRFIKVTSTKYKLIAQELGYIDSRKIKGKLKQESAIAQDSDFLKLVDLVRLTNQNPVAEVIKDICHHFEIPDIWEFSIVASAVDSVLKTGESVARLKKIFDFTDQIWLPVKWESYKRRWFKPFKFVLVDEAQDLNAAQLELSLALAGKTGRLLYVGDPRQAIMGFAGADNRSYQKIIELTKASVLPLSICYRCPRSHIELVKKIYPDIPIEPREDGPEGIINLICEQELDKHLHTGDMVISRKTAPLVSLCIKLIARGIAATVKGRAIGEQIKSELEQISKMPGFRYENFNDAVNAYRHNKIQRYRNLDNEEQLIETLNDKLQALTTIYKSNLQATSIAHLESYIDDLFSDEHSPITLSTCHRAKGLENDRIFIIKPDDMPMTWRNQLDWQKEQEDNLLYVALTRSKSELFIVGTPSWYQSPTTTDEETDATTLKLISPKIVLETTVKETLGTAKSGSETAPPVSSEIQTKNLSVNNLQWSEVVEQKRILVSTTLLEPDWQGRSDRAIAEYCGVSAPMVGKVRKRLKNEGRIQENIEVRFDKKGRKINTSNIGTKPSHDSIKQKISQLIEGMGKEEILELSSWLNSIASVND